MVSTIIAVATVAAAIVAGIAVVCFDIF